MNLTGAELSVTQVSVCIRILAWAVAFGVAFVISIAAARATDRNGYRVSTLMLFAPLTLFFGTGFVMSLFSFSGNFDFRIALTLPLFFVAVGMVLFYDRLKHYARHVDERGRVADERDRIADERDRVADERDMA